MRRSLVFAATIIFIAAAASAEWKAGVAAYQARDWAKAQKEFEEVTKTNPDYAGGHYMLGLTLKNLRQNAAAIEAFKKANSLEPENAGYAAALAGMLLDQNKASEAEGILSKAKTQDLRSGQKAAFLLLEAKAKIALGDDRAATGLARQATQADSGSAEAWGMLGTVQSRLDRVGDAFTSYEKAFEISGDASYAKNAIAAGMRAARLTKSAKAYQDVAGVGKRLYAKQSNPDVALSVGEALMGAKNYDEALSWFDRSGLDNALVSFYKGQSYSGKDQFARAETFFRQALQKRPDARLKKNIYASLGYVLDAQKKYGDAAAMYSEAGDSAKEAEMRDKEKKAAQNRKADEEAKRIEELKKIQQEMEKLQKGAVPTPPPGRK